MTDNRTTELHEVCGDDRFDLIAKAREKLLDSTNIESRPEEVAVLDSILFRCWQMGWLDQLRDDAATLGSGTLTAEQVRGVIISADRWEKPMGNTGLTNTHLIIRDNGWQAIADELNAELGSGTCGMDYIDTYEDTLGDEQYLCLCSECGSQMWEPAHDLPLYCRKCGRRVKR